MGYPTGRLDMSSVADGFYRMLMRLDRESRQFGLDPALLELVRFRASQLNGCAFCLDMHAKDARVAGESEQRLYLIAAWRETPFFNRRERAALALTDAMTALVGAGVGDDVYAQAASEFSEAELAGLIAVITVINAWNRIGVTTQMQTGHYTPERALR